MSSDTYFFTEHCQLDFEKIPIPILNYDEMNIIKSCIEIVRHLQEIDELYHVFSCNLDIIHQHFILNTNDTFERKIFPHLNHNDHILINSLTINYISSAKTLTDSIEAFIKKNTDIEFLKKFKDEYISKVYDENFYYRLLYHLRNFSQHGHLPVSFCFNGKLCFDLNQILSTPSIKLNATLTKEMEQIKIEIEEKFKDYPHIVFTKSIAEYNLCIINIYLNFLSEAEQILCNSVIELKELLNARPELVYNSSDKLNGYVFYEFDEKNKNRHAFNSTDDSMKMILEFKNNMIDIKKIEEKNIKVFDDMKLVHP